MGTRYNTYKMYTPIQIIPKIQSLELENVGCWKSLRLEFVPGVNIITEEDGGLGKSTILSSIMSQVRPRNDMGLVAPRLVPGKSRITVELMSSGGTFLAGSRGEIPPHTGVESHGQYIMRLLTSSLAMAEPDCAVIFDDEVFGALDDPHRSRAAELLNESSVQVICVIPHRLNPADFPDARIYACSWDRDKEAARMRQLQ